MVPSVSKFLIIGLRVLIGIEKPIFSAPLDTATLIPITSPCKFKSGPPEFPGFNAASV